MKYQVQENCLTIFLPSEIDHHNSEELRRESDHLIERNHIRYVIFDFKETDFMDSSGIGVIMGRSLWLYVIGGESDKLMEQYATCHCGKSQFCI